MSRWIVVLLAFVWCPALAHAGNVVLTDETDSYMLGPALELFEDPTGMLSVEDVADAGFAGPFRTTSLQIPSPGLTRSAWWARVTFDTTVAPKRIWYLVHREPIVDRISVFVPRPDGGWTSLHGGLLSAERFFRLDHRYWVFPITLPVGSDVSVYVRVENRDNIILPLALQTVDALYRADRVEQLLFGALYGILLTVCVYLFFIWKVMRDRSQAWLIMMELAVAWYIGSQSGFLAELVWPGAGWDMLSSQMAIISVMICALSFTRHCLRTDEQLPRLSVVLRLLAVGTAAFVLLAPADLRTFNRVMPYAAIVNCTVMLLVGLASLRARVEAAAVYMLAFLCLIMGGLLRALVDIGTVPATSLTLNLFPVGAGISAIVFAIGIAGQFRARQEEKEKALRLSNERFALAAEGASTGLYDWDLTHGGIYFSPRMTELLGAAPRSASRNRPFWLDLIHPGDAERIAEEFRAFLDSGARTISMSYRIVGPEGVLRWVCTTGAAVRDPVTGRLLRLAGSTGDVTEAKRAEVSLKASESLKSAILNSSLDCIVSSDAEGRIIEFNPAAERTFGYGRAEVLGRLLADVIIPRHLRERHRDGVRRYRAIGGSRLLGRRFEIEAMRRDGTVFPVELAITEVSFGGDTVFSAFVRDITERRRSEEDLRDSRRQLAEKSRFLEMVLATIAQGISVVDADLRLRLVNDRFLEMYGFTRDMGVSGTPMEDLMRWRISRDEGRVADVDERIAERLAPLRSTVEARSEEVRPDGRVIEVWHRPMRGGGTVAVFSDVTERKRAEEALRASEARFRGIAEANPIPITIESLDGSRVLYASPRAADFLGAPVPVLLQCRPADFYADPADRAKLVERVAQTGEMDLLEVVLRRLDGGEFPAAISARIIEYEGYQAVVSGLSDLTFRKQAEQEIARQREALHQSEKLAALGSLLAGVAHELNNPLSVVVGQSVIMEDTARDDRTRARAARIHKAADRCARIVKTFLALARRRPPQRTEVDFNDIVEASLDLVDYALKADGIVVVRDPAPDLPRFLADADQLNQVVTNLIVNARQAMTENPRERRLHVRTAFDPDTGHAVLEVADNGPGVPADIRSRIFEPFFTTKPMGVGTGVGLSMCHNIVDAHGGAVSIEDTPGGGATFVVRLPAAVQAGAALPERLPAESLPEVGPCRILIVDDEPEIALTIADFLEPAGHIIDVAENGSDALARLEVDRPYDLIVSDLRMPELDGPGLYREVRARWPELASRFVFLTGDTLSISVQGFLSETGVPVVEKPVTGSELHAVVARMAKRGAPHAVPVPLAPAG